KAVEALRRRLEPPIEKLVDSGWSRATDRRDASGELAHGTPCKAQRRSRDERRDTEEERGGESMPEADRLGRQLSSGGLGRGVDEPGPDRRRKERERDAGDAEHDRRNPKAGRSLVRRMRRAFSPEKRPYARHEPRRSIERQVRDDGGEREIARDRGRAR